MIKIKHEMFFFICCVYLGYHVYLKNQLLMFFSNLLSVLGQNIFVCIIIIFVFLVYSFMIHFNYVFKKTYIILMDILNC